MSFVGHVSVYGDAVEISVHCVSEEGWSLLVDMGAFVKRDAEEGCHICVYVQYSIIPAPLGNAGKGVGGSGGGREGEWAGEEFGKGVGCIVQMA